LLEDVANGTGEVGGIERLADSRFGAELALRVAGAEAEQTITGPR